MRWKVGNVIMLLFVVLSGLTGCGDSDQNAAQTPPVISSLQYTPASLTVNAVTLVDWQFDFADAGGDILTGTYKVYNPNGVQVYTNTINLSALAGKTTGTQIGTTSPVSFVTVGTYTVDIYVTDSAGANSNTLTATFTIVP